MLGVVAHTLNPNTWGAEAGRFLRGRGQPDLHSEFQDNQGYTDKPYLGILGVRGEEKEKKTEVLEIVHFLIGARRKHHSNGRKVVRALI